MFIKKFLPNHPHNTHSDLKYISVYVFGDLVTFALQQVLKFIV